MILAFPWKMVKCGCCDKRSLKRGPWTAEEDEKLLAYIQQHGHGCWRSLPSKAGLERCGKSCRLRWTNYLRPDIKRGNFSLQEEQKIILLHALIGNRWSAIANHLPNRTDNEIKNYWNSRLKKRLTKMGIDPITHKPKALSQSKELANINHMAQWESARVEAEARLRRESKLMANPLELPPPQPQPPCLDVWEWTNPASLILNGFSPSNMLPSVPTVELLVENPSDNDYNQNDVGGISELDHLVIDQSSNYVHRACLGLPTSSVNSIIP